MEKRYKILFLVEEFLPRINQAIRTVDNVAIQLNDDAEVTVATLTSVALDIFKPYKLVTAKSITKLYNRIKDSKFDIIHVHSTGQLMRMGIKIASRKNIPIVATVHNNIDIDEKTKGKASKRKVRSVIRDYNLMTELFVASPYVAEDLRENGFKGKVSYLPLASDLSINKRNKELIEEANQIFGLKESDNVLISMGNVRKTKRIDFALNSLKLLKNKGMNFKYFVIGAGEEIPKLRELSERLKLNKNVKFLGRTDDDVMSALMTRADLLLYPSIFDYFGMAKVECAGFGTCGVFIRDSYVANEVFHNTNGYLSSNNEESYSETILHALQDKKQLSKVSKTAYADLYITWEKCASMLNTRMKEIITEHSSINKRLKK